MYWQAASLIAVLLLLWFFIRFNRKYRQPRLKVTRRTHLLENHVTAFKQQLEQALKDDFDVFSQVCLGELLICNAAKDRASQALLRQIQSTSVDFVLVDKDTGSITCVLVLVHHDRPGPRQRFIRQACEHGHLPCVQFDEHNALSDEQIRHKIKTVLEPTIVLDETTTDDVKVYLEPEHDKDQQKDEASIHSH